VKKIAVIALVCLMGAGSAFATVSVNWITFAQILDPANPGNPVADGSVAQLIWSPDKTLGAFNPSSPLTPQGNDILVVQSATAFGGFIIDGVVNIDGAAPGTPLPAPYNVDDGELDGLPFGDYSFGPPVAGQDSMVYTRIFNSPAPGFGDWYGEASLMTLSDQDPPAGAGPGPQTLDFTGGVNTALTTQIIPEPATWAFMGLGLVAAVAWRRRR
jgi:hypothetical protein